MNTLTIVLVSVAAGFLLALVLSRLVRSNRSGSRPSAVTRAWSEPAAVDPSQTQVSQQVLELVLKGEKIRAIKQLRDERPMGLAEAKDVIDSIDRLYNVSGRH